MSTYRHKSANRVPPAVRLAIAVGMVLLCICQSCSSPGSPNAGKGPESEAGSQNKNPAQIGDNSAGQGPVIVGGWNKVDVDSDDAKKDFDVFRTLAEKTHPEIALGKVVKMDTQLVAGINTRFTVEWSGTSGKGILVAVMYTDLDGKASITGWDQN